MTRLRSYIDQLLAVVLEQSPGLLEGMPRRQQGKGQALDMLRSCSVTEVPFLSPFISMDHSYRVCHLVASGTSSKGA